MPLLKTGSDTFFMKMRLKKNLLINLLLNNLFCYYLAVCI